MAACQKRLTLIQSDKSGGLLDEFAGNTPKNFIRRHIRLRLITSVYDDDEVLALAWMHFLQAYETIILLSLRRQGGVYALPCCFLVYAKTTR